MIQACEVGQYLVEALCIAALIVFIESEHVDDEHFAPESACLLSCRVWRCLRMVSGVEKRDTFMDGVFDDVCRVASRLLCWRKQYLVDHVDYAI